METLAGLYAQIAPVLDTLPERLNQIAWVLSLVVLLLIWARLGRLNANMSDLSTVLNAWLIRR